LDRLHRRSKIGTTLLFGTRFVRMMARWKHNFMKFNLEGVFRYMFCSGSKKTMEDEAATRIGWKSVMTIWLEPWLDDNKKLKDNWATKEMKWIWFSNTWQ
jgi:hypothetical protein